MSFVNNNKDRLTVLVEMVIDQRRKTEDFRHNFPLEELLFATQMGYRSISSLRLRKF